MRNWSGIIITAFDEGREIAWTIDGTLQPPIGHVYGYRLDAIDGGTRVTSYYDWSNIHEAYEPMADDIFPVISETNLRATLGILARVVAPGRPVRALEYETARRRETSSVTDPMNPALA